MPLLSESKIPQSLIHREESFAFGPVILLRLYLSEGGAQRMIYPAGENLFIKVYHWAAMDSYNLTVAKV